MKPTNLNDFLRAIDLGNNYHGLKPCSLSPNSLWKIIENKPSLNPCFLPIAHVIEAIAKVEKLDHKIELRALLSCMVYELAGSDLEACESIVANTRDYHTKLQLKTAIRLACSYYQREAALT